MIPEVNGEVFYMRKLGQGDQYNPHVDYFKGEEVRQQKLMLKRLTMQLESKIHWITRFLLRSAFFVTKPLY